MNTGMQDACNLAWKLALVYRKTCDDHLLDSYSPERSAVGDHVLESAGRLTAVATMRNPIAQKVRNLVGHLMLGVGVVQHAFADNLTQVSIGYPRSPLNGPALGGSGPKPGEPRFLSPVKYRSARAASHSSPSSPTNRRPWTTLFDDFRTFSNPAHVRRSDRAETGWCDPMATLRVRRATCR